MKFEILEQLLNIVEGSALYEYFQVYYGLLNAVALQINGQSTVCQWIKSSYRFTVNIAQFKKKEQMQSIGKILIN